MPSAALTWIEPGASATFIWHGAAAPRPGGGRLYVVSGPILEQPPASPYFILAAEDEGDFAARLYRGRSRSPSCAPSSPAAGSPAARWWTTSNTSRRMRSCRCCGARRLARPAGAARAPVSRRHQRVHARRRPALRDRGGARGRPAGAGAVRHRVGLRRVRGGRGRGRLPAGPRTGAAGARLLSHPQRRRDVDLPAPPVRVREGDSA